MFKNVMFSSSQDLVAQLTYAAVERPDFRSSQTFAAHSHAIFGIKGHEQTYEFQRLSNPKFATAFAAPCKRTSGSGRRAVPTFDRASLTMSAYNVTSSSELMQNYIQSDILQPQKKFIALQTDSGTSLLFSVGTDDAFYVTKELPA